MDGLASGPVDTALDHEAPIGLLKKDSTKLRDVLYARMHRRTGCSLYLYEALDRF